MNQTKLNPFNDNPNSKNIYTKLIMSVIILIENVKNIY